MRDTHRGLTAAAALLAACALALALLPGSTVSAYADGEEAEETEEAAETDEEDAEEESEDTEESEEADEEGSEGTDEDDDSEDESDEDITVESVTYELTGEGLSTSITVAAGQTVYFTFAPSSSACYKITFSCAVDLTSGGSDFGFVEGIGSAGYSSWSDDGLTWYYDPFVCADLTGGETVTAYFYNGTDDEIVISGVSVDVVKSLDDAEVTLDPSTYELPEGGLDPQTVLDNLTVTYDGVELTLEEDYFAAVMTDEITSPGTYYIYVSGMAGWVSGAADDSAYYGGLTVTFTVTLPSSSLIELTVDGGAVEATLEADGVTYYSFTPESDGFYLVSVSATTAAWAEVYDSDWSYMNIDGVYADSEETGVNGGFFKGGQTYYIAVYDHYSGEGGTVSVEVTSWDAPVTEITELDVAYEVTSSEDWWVSYAVFSPTTSGTYTITLAFAEGSCAEFWLFDENGYDVDYEESWEDYTCTIVVDLEAGVTYQLQLYMFGFDEEGNTTTDGSYTLTITVSSDEEGAGLASAVLGGTSDATDTSTTDTSSSSSSSTTSSTSSDSTVPATGDDAALAAAPLALAGVAACALGLALRGRRAR